MIIENTRAYIMTNYSRTQKKKKKTSRTAHAGDHDFSSISKFSLCRKCRHKRGGGLEQKVAAKVNFGSKNVLETVSLVSILFTLYITPSSKLQPIKRDAIHT